ncbi:MAG: hypothetical protein KKB02_09410, partial [Alphaproteobacteria bacterium]|nr:hypothetical protein [Alphaproteobacteria bacterium]
LHDVTLPALDDANAVLMDLLLPEAALIHQALANRKPTGYAPATLAQIRAGAVVPAIRYIRAKERQTAIRKAVDMMFDTCDVLLSPTVPFTAPFEDPLIEDGGDSEISATGFANLTGHPSIALPCGRVDGLPVSLQVTGPRAGDAFLLSAAQRIETALSVRLNLH